MQSWNGKGNEEGTKVLQWRKNDRAYGQEKSHHLYIVLDDWSWGYSIRKIDLSFGYPSHHVTPHSGCRHCSWNILPSASFKFEAPRGYPKYFANAFDSKILAMQPMDSKFKKNSMDGVLIYDVGMRSFIVGPRQTPDPVDPIYIPVGGSLFALGDGSFQVLYPPSHQSDRVWTWHTLQEPPFAHQLVTCYAVNSDGRIFFSIQGPCPATFSFDTAESVTNINCGWKYHGKWVMPFYGCAYSVPELDACVGLVGKFGKHGCCIGAIEDSFDGNLVLKKLCEDDLTCVTEERGDIGATLVSVGGNKFCLLKYTRVSDVDVLTGSSTSKENLKEEVILQLVKFSLKYDKNGALRKGTSCHVDCYGVPSGVTSSMLSNPVAFWM